ncbi:SCO family protein [Aromatoleum aromaticum]|uniref:Probable transmembrane protein n=1 Tax=Aromatoleum aromaticum (strain DSM 19018 / LMG 30748 / EbN1) TaxID=76114 RepID=Q5P2E5_AROAE|nr:hypothetical protein [Aromatoleum aromaticum]NMG54688.1 hypothetical protein [Aromatoleum aromaticum]CAI08519.1 probable transmembrane protein [Aromatoleum aromaticum EbN1]
MTQRSAKLTLAVLVLVCTLPVAASYFAYYVWQPQGQVNYGELIPPAPLPDAVLPGVSGQPPFEREALDGRWTLVYAGSGACGADCERALYAARQSRLAQGKEMTRVERLWLVTDDVDPPAALLGRYEGLRVARAGSPWLVRFPGATQGVHMFLVDPLGNVMMRFPVPTDIKRVIKDLERLLKYSGLGRG